MFFETAVQIPNVRHDIDNDFTVRDYFQPQHTMRRWVLWPHAQNHLTFTECIGLMQIGFRSPEVAGSVFVLDCTSSSHKAKVGSWKLKSTN